MKKGYKAFCLYLTDADWSWIRNEAYLRKTSMSEIIRELIRRDVDGKS